MTDVPIEKQVKLILFIGKLKQYNPQIGIYRDSHIDNDGNYFVELSNGMILIGYDLLEDFIATDGKPGQQLLKKAAHGFVSDPEANHKSGWSAIQYLKLTAFLLGLLALIQKCRE